MVSKSNSWTRFSLVLSLFSAGGLIGCDMNELTMLQSNRDEFVIDAGRDRSVESGERILLSASIQHGGMTWAPANISNGDESILYSWSQVEGVPVPTDDSEAFRSRQGRLTMEFDAPEVQDEQTLVFAFTFRIGSDSASAKRREFGDKVRIKVFPDSAKGPSKGDANFPPIADAGNDQIVFEEESVVLDGSASSDPNQDTLTFDWAQTSGPPVVLPDSASATATFTAPEVEEDVRLEFSLTVSDGSLASVDSVTVEVLTLLDASSVGPVADAGPDQVVTENELVTLDGSESFGSGEGALVFSWSQLSGQFVSLNNAAAAVATFVAPDVAGSEALNFGLTITDGEDEASDDVQVTVNNDSSGEGEGSGGSGGDPPPSNEAPQGLISGDRTLTIVDDNFDCEEVHALVGTESSDTEDDALGLSLGFLWTSSAGDSVFDDPNSPTPTATLPVGTTIITLKVTDTGGLTDTDQVVVTVYNEAPTAEVVTASTRDDVTPVMIKLFGSDPEGMDLTFSIDTPPPGGQLGPITPLDGSPVTEAEVLYTPNPGTRGLDSFAYLSWDGCSASEGGQVHIAVEFPAAVPLKTATIENQELVITLVGIDPYGNDLDFTIVTQPTHGSLGSINDPLDEPGDVDLATIVYTPDPNFNGADDNLFDDDTFRFLVTDPNSGRSAEAEAIDIEVYAEVEFIVEPIETSRGSPVELISRTVEPGDHLPPGGYRWVVDFELDMGKRNTHNRLIKTFSTAGQHTVRLVLGLVGLASPYACTNPQTGTNQAIVAIRPYISGTIVESGLAPGTPLEGVTVTAAGVGSVVSDGNGQYTLEVPYGWTGEVTPSLSPWLFDPPSASFVDVIDDSGRAFSGSHPDLTIAGTIIAVGTGTPVENVSVRAVGIGAAVGYDDDATTDAEGGFTLTIPYRWTGVVTPTLTDWTFDPESRTHDTPLFDHLSGQDHLGNPPGVRISGVVSDYYNDPRASVEIVFSGTGSSEGVDFASLTDVDGHYAQSVPEGWSGEVDTDDNHRLVPAGRSYSSVASDISGEDYASFRNYYVDDDAEQQQGFDPTQAPGTINNAYDALKTATNLTRPGDSVFLRTGTYTQQDVQFAVSGEPGAPITVAAYPGEERTVILQQNTSPPGGRGIFTIHDVVGHPPGYGYFIFRGFVMRNVGNAFWFGSQTARVHDLLLDNIEFRDCETAIKTNYFGVERIIVRNCEAHDCSSDDGAFNFRTSHQRSVPGSGSRDLVFLNNKVHDIPHQRSSGILFQEQCENSILIGNEGYGHGQYSFTSKAGGYHIWLNNVAYNNGKGGFYLNGPFKDYGGGEVINAAPGNYILLNNVAVGKREVDGGAIINWWRPTNVWMYNNTFLSLVEVVPPASNTPLTSKGSMEHLVYDYVTTGFAKNNIFVQAYGHNVHWYALTFNEDGVLPRRFMSDYNVHYSMGSTPADVKYKIVGRLVNEGSILNLNLDFDGWKDWFLSDQGDAVDANTLWTDPLFVDFDRSDDSRWQDLRLIDGSPAIDAGSPHGDTADEYPQKIEEFLTQWNFLRDFDDGILSVEEKDELVELMRTAHLRDIDGRARSGNPDIGAYETVAP